MKTERDAILFELEQRLAQAGEKISVADASSLIAEDFLEFGASGKVWKKPEILLATSEWEPNQRKVEDFSVRELGPSICLVTYRAVGEDGQPSPFSLRSSIWRHDGAKRQIVFHQGTTTK